MSVVEQVKQIAEDLLEIMNEQEFVFPTEETLIQQATLSEKQRNHDMIDSFIAQFNVR